MGGHLRTAFAALPAAQSLTPVLTDVLAARSWKAREQHLSAAKPAPQAKDRNKQNGTEANVRARTAAFVLSVVLVFYLGLCSWEGALALYDGFTGGGAASGLLGGAVLVFGFFGGWFLVREIRFGFATERLAKQLDDEGGLRQEEVDTLPRSPGGRVERAAADRLFERRKAQTEADKQDWRAWYRLAVAYSAAKDNSRARAAMRHAIRLHAEAGPGRRHHGLPADPPGR